MKQFNAFVKKEFFHIFRDRRTLFILLCMPIVQIILFGFALTNEVKNARIAVLDQSGDASSTSLVAELDASRYFDVVARLHSASGIEQEFRKGTIKLAVVLPANFDEDLQHLHAAKV